jgi:hypothetical protein
MNVGRRATMLCGLLALAGPALAEVSWPGLGVTPTPRMLEPAASSVMFSTRFERPEARSIAAEFGATHFTWLYPKTRDYVAGLRAQGLSVGTTLNANQPVRDEGLARDFEGKPLVAPWMQSWGARWVSISSPATRSALFEAAQRHISWGADAIQFDDPALATAAFGWGGDFSDAAVKNFDIWLASPAAESFAGLPAEARSGHFDYRIWLASRGIETTSAYLAQRNRLPLNAAWERFHLEEVRTFFATLRSSLHAGPTGVALNLNLTNPRPDARTFQLVDLADGVMSETSADDLANAALGAATVQSTGATYLPSLQPHELVATRRQIAGFYALGALPLVPWDVYMPDLISTDKQRTPQPRYFGTAAQYSDLYRFVRSQPTLFDAHQPLASVLLICQVEHFKAAEVLNIVRQLQARQIPFAMMIARSSYPTRALDAERISQAPAVIFASAFSGLDAASEAALKAAERKRIKSEEIDAQSARLAPLSVQASTPLLIVPRVDPAHPQELIVHLVRNGDDMKDRSNGNPGGESGNEANSATVRLNPALVPFQRIASVESFTPGMPVQTITTKGLAFSTPLQGEWVVLRIHLQ